MWSYLTWCLGLSSEQRVTPAHCLGVHSSFCIGAIQETLCPILLFSLEFLSSHLGYANFLKISRAFMQQREGGQAEVTLQQFLVSTDTRSLPSLLGQLVNITPSDVCGAHINRSVVFRSSKP